DLDDAEAGRPTGKIIPISLCGVVWTWLPGAEEPVVEGRIEPAGGRHQGRGA
ncbi:MAG: hypothetical protein QOG94_2249, partial [Solirubrobacteraceae bacterium]|nr:hypothetical protein [Solirubrobacteraceae bacterium]